MELAFDSDWRFLSADIPDGEKSALDDSDWRKLDVPHDWSIEDLPPRRDSTTEAGGQSDPVGPGIKTARIGPFDVNKSQNQDRTGYTVGGVGWYRKHFILDEVKKLVSVRFDGVYMNCEVWINGHLLGRHPYGYTSFEFDLTPFLSAPSQENILVVRVNNDGKNSRWYSGSGIYRHVWLKTSESVHVPTWGVFVTTPEVSRDKARARIIAEIQNADGSSTEVLVRARVRNPSGEIVAVSEAGVPVSANETKSIEQDVEIPSPQLWSPDTPSLYSVEVETDVGGRVVDRISDRFGIRKIEVDAEHGLRLNGETVKLKGGCMHHDNGPLGAAAIDRAEERKIQLLKANGFNAIRTSHNPPSPALLDACDHLGMLVIDEAFDQWNEAKAGNEQDYHLYFKEWYQRDVASWIRRDRNHPSVVMWSIGNEIPEQLHAEATALALREAVLAIDPTRPLTQAVFANGGEVYRDWDRVSDPAFLALDIGGYNYLPDKYESDHARHPERVMMGTESYPNRLYDYWSLVEKHPYVIGDFVWTAMDYLGETGIGHSVLSDQKDGFCMPWPWVDAWCGDLDICGFKKPQSFYRDVVWGRSQLELAVHRPVPPGLTERVSEWGWPDEAQSWNWPGQEGKGLQVSVYSRCETIRLELNGKIIGEQPVSVATKFMASFDVPYAPGELVALGLVDGNVVARVALRTTGAPHGLRLTPDRAAIRADRQDLCYVTIEVVDEDGQRVPEAEVPVHFSVQGTGELAAQASGSPNKPASFKAPVCETFQGRCLVILRPSGDAGTIELRAESEKMQPASLTIQTR